MKTSDEKDSKNTSKPLVVKVCHFQNTAKQIASQNEAKILQKLKGLKYVTQIQNYYEDVFRETSYLVLEKAGPKSIRDLVLDFKNLPVSKGKNRTNLESVLL